MIIDDAEHDMLRPKDPIERNAGLPGTSRPVAGPEDYSGADAPVPIEELQRRLKEESGRPLSEILADLDSSAGRTGSD